MSEAFQTYINIVTGVTKSTQVKASRPSGVVQKAGLEDVAMEAGERVTKLAEEIMNASRINREPMQHFVTAEVDKAAGEVRLRARRRGRGTTCRGRFIASTTG